MTKFLEESSRKLLGLSVYFLDMTLKIRSTETKFMN